MLRSISQRDFLEPGYLPVTAGLGDDGYIYIPHACNGTATTGDADGNGDGAGPCRLHVAFHGCEQTIWDVGEQYMTTTGLAAWAGINRMVLLFPQARRTDLNPKGCFDWWGYTGVDFASQLGVQMKAVQWMVKRLLGTSI